MKLLKDLNPNPKNPRTITEKKLQMLKKSMAEFGSLDGILYNVRTKRLFGGHQRQKVNPEAPIFITHRYDPPSLLGTVAEGYIESNGEKYPYREVDWPEKRELAANLAANKGAGQWDFPQLSNWFIDLDDGAFDLDLTMFDLEEREKIVTHVSSPDNSVNEALPDGEINEKELDETIETHHECPSCAYRW